jgi:hypothetical protein
MPDSVGKIRRNSLDVRHPFLLPRRRHVANRLLVRNFEISLSIFLPQPTCILRVKSNRVFNDSAADSSYSGLRYDAVGIRSLACWCQHSPDSGVVFRVRRTRWEFSFSTEPTALHEIFLVRAMFKEQLSQSVQIYNFTTLHHRTHRLF